MKYYKFSFDFKMLNILSILLFAIFFIPCAFYFDNFEFGALTFSLMFIWLWIHEIIHGIGFSINKEVSFKNVTFGALLEKGILYCMCKQKISKKSILIALILPLVVIGFITLIISFIINDGVLAFLSCLNISGAIGDIVMFIMITRMPKEIYYIDLDEPDSFILLSNHDLNNYLIPGVSIDEEGLYTEDMTPHDFKKLTISKTSMIIFIIIFIIILLSLI